LQALPQLDQLISKTEILTEQPRLDPWLARVLITELLWGKKCLGSNSKPIVTLLSYEYKLREEARNLNCIDIPIADGKAGNHISSSVNNCDVLAFLQRFGLQTAIIVQ
jgi:putative methyltransferase